jgi:carbon storage regulator
MLVIRRRAGESLFIGDDVEIKVLEVGPTQIKLGIAAPKEITVLRSEVRQTQLANRAAADQGSAEVIEDLVKKLRG